MTLKVTLRDRMSESVRCDSRGSLLGEARCLMPTRGRHQQRLQQRQLHMRARWQLRPSASTSVGRRHRHGISCMISISTEASVERIGSSMRSASVSRSISICRLTCEKVMVIEHKCSKSFVIFDKIEPLRFSYSDTACRGCSTL